MLSVFGTSVRGGFFSLGVKIKKLFSPQFQFNKNFTGNPICVYIY